MSLASAHFSTIFGGGLIATLKNDGKMMEKWMKPVKTVQ